MERIKWVDNLKGVILFLVCIGHLHYTSKLGYTIDSATRPFRMTTFFFLSGYLFSTRKHPYYRTYFFSKSKSLIIPYFYLSIIYSFIDLRLYDVSLIPRHPYINFPIFSTFGITDHITNSAEYLYLGFVSVFISGTSTPIATPLWFVFVLYLCCIIFYTVYKLCKGNRTIIFVFSMVCICIGWTFNLRHLFFPFNFHVTFTALFFFSLGFILREFINKLHKCQTVYLLVPLVPLSFLYLYAINHSSIITLHNNHLGNNFVIFITSTISGIILIITISIILSRIPKTTIIGGIFRNLARNAIIFLGLHYFIITTADLLFPHFSHLTAFKNTVLICTLIITIISIPIFRNKFYWLLGKKKISIRDSLSLK